VRHPLTAWLAAATLGAEAQWVIALRMMRLAAGGTVAAGEAQRMISEKVVANAQAQFAEWHWPQDAVWGAPRARQSNHTSERSGPIVAA
jgi:hypothetical protein